MSFRTFIVPLALSAAISCLLPSCVTSPLRSPAGGSNYLAGLGVSSVANVPANPAEASSFWDGDSVHGSPMIRINVRKQEAYFYKNGELVGLSPVSTGTDEYSTPRGSFRVSQKAPDYKSSRYGRIVDQGRGIVINDDADSQVDRPGPGQVFEGAPMPFFLRFNHGIGMHAGHLPGYAASHGCVRMPLEMARKFFEHATVGTPVIVE